MLNDILIPVLLSHCRTLRPGQTCRFHRVGDDLRVNGAGGANRWHEESGCVRDDHGERWEWQGKQLTRAGNGRQVFRQVGKHWQWYGAGRVMFDNGERLVMRFGAKHFVEVIRQNDELFCWGTASDILKNKPPAPLPREKNPVETKVTGLVLLILIAALWAWLS